MILIAAGKILKLNNLMQNEKAFVKLQPYIAGINGSSCVGKKQSANCLTRDQGTAVAPGAKAMVNTNKIFSSVSASLALMSAVFENLSSRQFMHPSTIFSFLKSILPVLSANIKPELAELDP
jgi:hypothetical protein